MTKRTFYKTILRSEILSEEPIPATMTLADIYEETISGRFSGRPLEPEQIELNGRDAAAALREQGSDPSFFNLTDAGETEDALRCKTCGEYIEEGASLVDHLEQHNPNARQMEAERIQDCFEDSCA